MITENITQQIQARVEKLICERNKLSTVLSTSLDSLFDHDSDDDMAPSTSQQNPTDKPSATSAPIPSTSQENPTDTTSTTTTNDQQQKSATNPVNEQSLCPSSSDEPGKQQDEPPLKKPKNAFK
jgi:hypothetical protein